MPKCANVKNKKSTNVQCSYPAKKGEFCSRHWKNPIRFQISSPPSQSTRSITNTVKKIQQWWKQLNGFKLSKERTPAFFSRELCHNDTELATLEPLSTVPRDYFFVIRDRGLFWGYDIRTLLVQYEDTGRLENIYTTHICNAKTLESFRLRLDKLRRWKKPLVFETASNNLSVKQSWNLRVLDACLRLDMLGYRISTQWFSELTISEHRNLYNTLASLWNQDLNLTEDQRRRIVPEHNNPANKLFRWTAEKMNMKYDLDSIRRTNLNIIERLITSASEQSDKTLGAMYTVIGLCRVSYRCRDAYPWLA
jgi:hypothetical protein